MRINKNVVPFMARRSMACTVYQDKIYFFGGVGAGGTESILDVSNDLWAYTPSSGEWEQLVSNNEIPSPRRCVGFAPSVKGIILWGGSGLKYDTSSGKQTYSFLNDLWLYSPNQRRWLLLEDTDDHLQSPKDVPLQLRPEPRYTPAWHPLNTGQFFLFSGYTEDRLGKRKMNDLWIWEEQTSDWKKISNDGLQHGYNRSSQWPGLRYGAISAVCNSTVYVFGGFSDIGDHNDVWMWNAEKQNWECLASDLQHKSCPEPRYCAAGEHFDGGFWIFGGRSRRYPKMNFNDTWRFDLKDRRWEQIFPQTSNHDYGESAKSIGYHAKSASCILDGTWYLWGGEGLHGHVSDFWRFDFKDRTWHMIYPSRRDDPLFW